MQQARFVFVGFGLLVVMLGLIFFTGAIYDAENKHSIETYFFEPNNRSGERVDVPIAPTNMTQNYLRERIIEHFLHEYFYVVPDENNARARTQNFRDTNNTQTMIGAMTNSSVQKQWQEKIAPQIMNLAERHGFRTVQLLNISESESGHLVVDYKLKTWDTPNNVMLRPVETVGRMLLNVSKQPIQVVQTETTLRLLQKGTDPVAAFSFGIQDVVQE